jgi:hypothetical protein
MEEKNALDQHRLKKVAMFMNAQLTVYGVIGSMMSAQLNVVVEPSQWLESRPKRPCLEAKNVKERPMLSKHATSNLAQLIVLGMIGSLENAPSHALEEPESTQGQSLLKQCMAVSAMLREI